MPKWAKKKAETLKKFRDRRFTWGAKTGKMAFCIFFVPKWSDTLLSVLYIYKCIVKYDGI